MKLAIGITGFFVACSLCCTSPSHAKPRIEEKSTAPETAEAATTPAPEATIMPPAHVAMHENYASYDDQTLRPEQPLLTRRIDTMQKKTFQIETSFAFERDSTAGTSTRQYSFPTRLRYGLVDNWEIQAEGGMATFRDSSTGNASGFGDFFLGTKFAALEGGGLLPSVGFVAELGVPTGSNSVSGNAVQPRGGAILAWRLPAKLHWNANLGMDFPAKDAAGDRFARLTYGTAIDRPLPFLNERMSAFGELAGASPLKSGKSGIHQAGTGLGVTIKERMQVNAFARVGLNTAAPNFQTGLGFSWRM